MSTDGQTSSTTDPFLHWCELCAREELLSTQDAFDAGWDFPPRMGTWGVISPRTCPKCPMASTVWWAVAMENRSMDELTPGQLKTVGRIRDEVPA